MKIEEGPKTNSRTSLHLQAFWKEGSWCGAAHLALSYPGGKCGGLSLGWASYRVVVGGTPGRRVTTGDDGDVMDLPMQLHRAAAMMRSREEP